MKMNEKIEILLNRRHIKKTDFADSVGITYRAFANYMSESRSPRREILGRIADALGTTPEFLTDETQELTLTAEERFLKRISDNGVESADAARFLTQSRGLFAGNELSDEDKGFLLECLTEIYNDSKKEKAGTADAAHH